MLDKRHVFYSNLTEKQLSSASSSIVGKVASSKGRAVYYRSLCVVF